MTVAYIGGRRPAILRGGDQAKDGCGPAWDALMAWADKNRLVREATVYAGVSHDDPSTTPLEKERYDACITVPDGTAGVGDVAIGRIAGREYAVFVHRGPYNTLEKTYDYIYKVWAPKAARKPVSDGALEIYKTPSQDTPPEELLTEVCIPLAE